ncbi:MAG: MauE/DoxX family redox-associated membrane protein [Desulfovibrio sp.]|uniref:MauE/DoxX family redox-associated membrane protein n=1 Tax=Desulfovibrio sp. 7SRBS1 TaxID=3378064 RepID=UPI003B41AE45
MTQAQHFSGRFHTLARMLFGGIFIAACISKIMHPDLFARIIYNYQILPDILVNITAITLPWLELVCGLALILGRMRLGAALILNLLLVVFIIVLSWNLARGLNVACGCFTTTAAEGNMTWDLLRDIPILILGLIVLRKELKKASA